MPDFQKKKKRQKYSLKIQRIYENRTIRLNGSENRSVEISNSYLQKCGILYFLPEERSWMRVYFVIIIVIRRGGLINPVVLKYQEGGSLKRKFEV